MANNGRWGEAQVANFLREKGYRLEASGYHCRFGELDIIAWDGPMLCFVEVKTRTNVDMALPREYVTKKKQAKLKKTALFFLADNDLDCPAALTWRRSMPRIPTYRPASSIWRTHFSKLF